MKSRPSAIMTTIFLTASLYNVCFASPSTTMPAQEVVAMFAARAKQVNSIIIRFTLDRRFNADKMHNVKDITLSWDCAGNRINATAVGDAANQPFIRKWVRSNTDEWHAQPEYVHGPKGASSPGDTWYVTRSAPNNSSNPEIINGVEFGLPWIQEAIVPFHLIHKNELGDRIINPPTIKSTGIPNHLTCEYEIKSAGHLEGWIAYELDVSDGLRMISCSLSAPGKDGKRVVNKQFSFADYHKSNDIWFPYHLIEKTLGQDGSVQSTNVMTVKEVKLNPRFDTDAFDYTPTFGSRVQDQRDHLEYRVGMEQPTSKPSS